MLWDAQFVAGQAVNNEVAVARIKQAFPDWSDQEKGVLILFSQPLFNPGRHGLQLLFMTKERRWIETSEYYYLYGALPGLTASSVGG